MPSGSYVRTPEDRANRRRLSLRHGHAGSEFGAAKRSPTYYSWQNLRARCLYPSVPSFPNYGGRGISVCGRWRSFANFLADMGERPPGTWIDRIDVNGNYEPGNCCWATPSEQQRNKRRTARSN